MVELEVDQDNSCIQIKGKLIQTTVMSAHKIFQNLAQSPRDWKIDFSQVTQVDSCALALLIEWKKTSRNQSSKIKFQHLPKALISIANLSQVEDLILQ